MVPGNQVVLDVSREQNWTSGQKYSEADFDLLWEQIWELCSHEEGCLNRQYELPVTRNVFPEAVHGISVLRGKPN